ncbi:MAG: Gmad2 immunoglobulin-like domain-containing protein [Elusimicrobiota bacterium]
MKKIILIIIVILIIAAAGAAAWILTQKEAPTPVLNPPASKDDLIRLDSPRPGQVIKTPLTITGEARGTWFFEASFPVILVNWDGLIIAQGIATAKSDPSTGLGVNWMTTEYVPFEAKLDFTIDKNTYSNRGWLILKKDNPSGLPEHDNALEIPIIFDDVVGSPTACTQEAKQCPDGSYVGRTGPNCEFAPCP